MKTDGRQNDDPSGLVFYSRWSKPKTTRPQPNDATGRIHPPPTIMTQQISPRHVFRQQLLESYLKAYLPEEVLTSRRIAAAKQRNWTLYLPELATPSPALESAILATCAARLGDQDGNIALVNASLVQYNKSLRELQQTLLHPALRCEEQTLATCMALAMYEFGESVELTGKVYVCHYSGYVNHYLGALEILRGRGPVLHTTGLGHSVYRALRLHGVSGIFVITSSTICSFPTPLTPRP
jgi:hypothetical protein